MQVQRSQSPSSPFSKKPPQQMEAVYQLKVRGAAILPFALRQLCRVVHHMHGNTAEPVGGMAEEKEEEESAAAGQRDWSVLMEVVPGTEAFNLPAEALRAAQWTDSGREHVRAVQGAVRAMRGRAVEEAHWMSQEQIFACKRVGRFRAGAEMQAGREA